MTKTSSNTKEHNMTTELAKVNADLMSNLPSLSMGSRDDFADLSKVGDYLGRIQLYSKGKPVDRKLIQGGHFGVPVSKDEIVDLGESIDVLIWSRRAKAIDMSDKDMIIVSYDRQDPEFQRIEKQSAKKDSKCMYGPSFLVFERSTAEFYEFFLGTKSFRREAGSYYTFMPLQQADIDAMKVAGEKTEGLEPRPPLPCTLTSKFVESGDFSWFVPEAKKCSTPFKNLPVDRLYKKLEEFLNPDKNKIEKVEDHDDDAPSGKRKRSR